MLQEKKVILTGSMVTAKLQRMALEIAENHAETNTPLIIIGVRNSGLVIAERIAALLQPYMETQILSVTLNKNEPGIVTLSEAFDCTDKNILLVDDVCNSGKTLLYALKPLLDFYPASIHTLVLVERMHKQFPVKPDYVGFSVATTSADFIQVEMEQDELAAYLIQ